MSTDPVQGSAPKPVDPRLFVAAGVGGLILLIGLVMLVLQGPVYGALILVPLLVLLAGLYWMKMAHVDGPGAQTPTGLAQMPQQPIRNDPPAPPVAAAEPVSPEDSDLGGDTPTVRGDRPRLRAAKDYDLKALMSHKDIPNPVQCPNCGQLARLSANGDRTRARCADCGAEWALGAVQPPTLVRAHVRTNVAREEPNHPDGASTAQPN